MRAREFVKEDSGSTTSGSIAAVSQPLGGVIKRPTTAIKTKYSNRAPSPWPQRIKNVS